MQNKRNYYRVLHLQPDAPQPMVRMAYRTIMQKLKAHPDLGGEEWNASLINEAYDVLSDPKKRASYDKNFFTQRSKEEAANQFEAQRNSEKQKADENSASERFGDSHTTDQSTGSKFNAQTQNENFSDHPNNKFYQEKNSSQRCIFCGSEYNSLTLAEESCSNCQSPINLKAISGQTGTDRRESLRMPSGSSIQYQLRSQYIAATHLSVKQGFAKTFQRTQKQPTHLARIIDISLSGVRLQSSQPLVLGEILRLETPEFIALAEVKNCLGDRPNTHGTQFVALKFKSDRGSFVSTAV